MNQPAQQTKIIKKFKKYLENKEVSDITIKNYASDLRQFLIWIAKTQKSVLDTSTYASYKTHLLEQNNPTKSINRYLSTLRKFGVFLTETSDLKNDPTACLKNINKQTNKKSNDPEILNQFRNSLKKENLSDATIKNYMSDIRQFWQFIQEKYKASGGGANYSQSKSSKQINET